MCKVDSGEKKKIMCRFKSASWKLDTSNRKTGTEQVYIFSNTHWPHVVVVTCVQKNILGLFSCIDGEEPIIFM